MVNHLERPIAPELDIVEWCNTSTPITLAALRGKVVLLHAFQMLCPGCVREGTPLAQRIHDRLSRRGDNGRLNRPGEHRSVGQERSNGESRFASNDLVVIGLHTVFEHHDAMKPVSLRAYLHEFRVTFPVGIDRHEKPFGMPVTMSAYNMGGTPTLIAIDRAGRIGKHWFGRVDELEVGMTLANLIAESIPTSE